MLSKAWVLAELHAEIQREPAGLCVAADLLGASETGHSTWAVHGAVTSVISHQAVLFGFNNALVTKTTEHACQGAAFYVGREPHMALAGGACLEAWSLLPKHVSMF